MSKVCKKCGYYINYDIILEAWTDEDDDDACYDNELNFQGFHEPVVTTTITGQERNYE